MNAQLHPSALGLGLYPLPDAARLVQLDPRSARRWAEGYSFKYRGERRESPGVIGAAAGGAGARDLTFHEMLTLRLVKGFRDAGDYIWTEDTQPAPGVLRPLRQKPSLLAA